MARAPDDAGIAVDAPGTALGPRPQQPVGVRRNLDATVTLRQSKQCAKFFCLGNFRVFTHPRPSPAARGHREFSRQRPFALPVIWRGGTQLTSAPSGDRPRTGRRDDVARTRTELATGRRAGHRRAARNAWALLLAHIYEVFPIVCPNGAGEERFITFITAPPIAHFILAHLASRPRDPASHPPAVHRFGRPPAPSTIPPPNRCPARLRVRSASHLVSQPPSAKYARRARAGSPARPAYTQARTSRPRTAGIHPHGDAQSLHLSFGPVASTRDRLIRQWFVRLNCLSLYSPLTLHIMGGSARLAPHPPGAGKGDPRPLHWTRAEARPLRRTPRGRNGPTHYSGHGIEARNVSAG